MFTSSLEEQRESGGTAESLMNSTASHPGFVNSFRNGFSFCLFFAAERPPEFAVPGFKYFVQRSIQLHSKASETSVA